jgi:mRNA interferase RelE/StbE
LAWKIEYTKTALQQLRKLDKAVAKRILDYMDERIGQTENPRLFGKALTGPLGDYWRYRIGDYRVVCDIQDLRVVVQVVRIGHRSDVYND